ncbi:Telomere repeats-binding bouquet formation protein 1 [Bagarius yarrelli]|uniref:Telomere repeats-binding bouquet formation protein 1 n=1 Tax=Bagarius yarrelli TaxID=175774 RepID=A0A556VVD3_BAGYA|nr:Telomere repeats-binding bouquet formation protein 1 [Bagarius yarrelli]
MKCPSSQKQALLTIVSICQQNTGQNVEFLREIGGVTFIYNLSRSSVHSEVKATALFTLSSLAEFNESCKQSVCREEVFCGLADCMEQEVSLTLRRVTVYTLCVLVSNNKQGQSLAMTSGCINILLNLFRSVYPMTEGTDELLQLWTSVSAALCGCVNNPQNEENQRACMCVFPLVKVWLQQVSVVRAELTQPICSFISMTVANNSFVQEYFASLGGLLTLSHTLSSAVSQCRENPAACVLATMITRTLSSCISNIETIVSVLSKINLVPDLLLLLSSPNLSSQDQLAVVLTLGRCTDACVEHQYQLVQGGGLPLMISLLTEANDEEVKKATTFVLQTCKQLISQYDLGKAIMHIYAQLTECREEVCTDCVPAHEEEREDVPQSFTPPTQPSPQTVAVLENQEPMVHLFILKKGVCVYLQQHVGRQLVKDCVNSFPKENQDQQRFSAQQTRGKRMIKNGGIEEMERETNPNGDRPIRDELRKEKPDGDTEDRNAHGPDIFKHPPPMKRHQRSRFRSEDELSVCSELLDTEIKRILITPAASKTIGLRCTGCVSGVEEVNSRTIGEVLRRCKSRCEFHRVLQRAEDRLKTSLCSKEHVHTHTSEIRDTGSSKTVSIHTLKDEESHKNRRNHKDAVRYTSSEVENRHASKNPREMMENGVYIQIHICFIGIYSSAVTAVVKSLCMLKHRDRKEYSGDELQYLTEGVRRFGHSWNTILWAYPFQRGRTNVDLARKYRRDSLTHFNRNEAPGDFSVF